MIMRDIPLNEFATDILDETLWFLKDENYKAVHMNCARNYNAKDADYFTSWDYFQKIREMAGDHDGYPESVCAYSFGSNGLNFHKDAGNLADEMGDRIFSFYEKIQTQLNLKKNALFTVYPPEHGFISWHNNANASAYNFIFTYSETGEGYWQHFDPVKNEMVTIPDVKGWQCKAGYFGSYQDGMDKVVYHTAKNTGKGLRMTIAFILDRSEMSSGLQSWVIDDIRAD